MIGLRGEGGMIKKGEVGKKNDGKKGRGRRLTFFGVNRAEMIY